MPENKTRKLDRRIQRTRALLRDALMRLILKSGESDMEKRYDEITVQDITDEANVARTTFYLHFRDKDELLFETMRDIYEDLYDSTNPPTLDTFLSSREEDCPAEDFQHVAEYADFYRIMLGERGSAAFLARVRQYLAEEVMGDYLPKLLPDDDEPRLPLELLNYMLAGAEIAAMKWWLDNNMPYTPRQMAFITDSYAKKGLLWALRLDEREPAREE